MLQLLINVLINTPFLGFLDAIHLAFGTYFSLKLSNRTQHVKQQTSGSVTCVYILIQPSKKHGLGHVQKWTLFLFKDTDADINLDVTNPKEFCAYKWTTLRELANKTVWFWKGIYKELADYFSKYLAE